MTTLVKYSYNCSINSGGDIVNVDGTTLKLIAEYLNELGTKIQLLIQKPEEAPEVNVNVDLQPLLDRIDSYYTKVEGWLTELNEKGDKVIISIDQLLNLFTAFNENLVSLGDDIRAYFGTTLDMLQSFGDKFTKLNNLLQANNDISMDTQSIVDAINTRLSQIHNDLKPLYSYPRTFSITLDLSAGPYMLVFPRGMTDASFVLDENGDATAFCGKEFGIFVRKEEIIQTPGKDQEGNPITVDTVNYVDFPLSPGMGLNEDFKSQLNTARLEPKMIVLVPHMPGVKAHFVGHYNFWAQEMIEATVAVPQAEDGRLQGVPAVYFQRVQDIEELLADEGSEVGPQTEEADGDALPDEGAGGDVQGGDEDLI